MANDSACIALVQREGINYCETCRWWDNKHGRLKAMPKVVGIENPGFCRKHKPGAYALKGFWIGVQPVMDGKEYCAEHRQYEEDA
jgi:hypothetical protein